MALTLVLAAVALGDRTQAQSPPDGYRMTAYRAPVPFDVPGATTVATADVQAMVADGDAILIDVLPNPRRPEGLSESSVWLPKPHDSLPGAVWLPNVGMGVLSDDLTGYYRAHLDRLTTAGPEAKLVIFCLPDCWMSWNAAKRAVEWGYGGIYWYPDGIVGWEAAGLPLEAVKPAPMPE